jgi:hypothetical protein
MNQINRDILFSHGFFSNYRLPSCFLLFRSHTGPANLSMSTVDEPGALRVSGCFYPRPVDDKTGKWKILKLDSIWIYLLFESVFGFKSPVVVDTGSPCIAVNAKVQTNNRTERERRESRGSQRSWTNSAFRCKSFANLYWSANGPFALHRPSWWLSQSCEGGARIHARCFSH